MEYSHILRSKKSIKKEITEKLKKNDENQFENFRDIHTLFTETLLEMLKINSFGAQ
jgi:hypothetical protein